MLEIQTINEDDKKKENLWLQKVRMLTNNANHGQKWKNTKKSKYIYSDRQFMKK